MAQKGQVGQALVLSRHSGEKCHFSGVQRIMDALNSIVAHPKRP
jgi:hypothetical protein